MKRNIVSLNTVISFLCTSTPIILTELVVDKLLPLTCTIVPVYPAVGVNEVILGGGHVKSNAATPLVPPVPLVAEVLEVPLVPLVPEVPLVLLIPFCSVILMFAFKSLEFSKLDKFTLTAEVIAAIRVSLVCLNSLVCES